MKDKSHTDASNETMGSVSRKWGWAHWAAGSYVDGEGHSGNAVRPLPPPTPPPASKTQSQL